MDYERAGFPRVLNTGKQSCVLVGVGEGVPVDVHIHASAPRKDISPSQFWSARCHVDVFALDLGVTCPISISSEPTLIHTTVPGDTPVPAVAISTTIGRRL